LVGRKLNENKLELLQITNDFLGRMAITWKAVKQPDGKLWLPGKRRIFERLKLTAERARTG
jgi:hypothetical protein